MNPISLGRQGVDSVQQELLRSVHETFAQELSGSLSAFLQSEISIRLGTISYPSASDFQSALQAPCGVISFQLEPQAEQAILYLDCSTVFGLLELLLGGSIGSGPPSSGQQRNLTEIEWELLEEVVRVIVAALGEAWKTFHPVEFKVLALQSDPRLLALSDPSQPLVQLSFALSLGEQDGGFQISVPRTFFEAAPNPDQELAARGGAESSPPQILDLLGQAKVELEVILEGPAMELRELARLQTGQVVRFDYPLDKPLRAVVNDTVAISCHMVNGGRKRAFQVERLP